MPDTFTTHERLLMSAKILDCIREGRKERGPGYGQAIEKRLVDRELADLARATDAEELERTLHGETKAVRNVISAGERIRRLYPGLYGGG